MSQNNTQSNQQGQRKALRLAASYQVDQAPPQSPAFYPPPQMATPQLSQPFYMNAPQQQQQYPYPYTNGYQNQWNAYQTPQAYIAPLPQDQTLMQQPIIPPKPADSKPKKQLVYRGKEFNLEQQVKADNLQNEQLKAQEDEKKKQEEEKIRLQKEQELKEQQENERKLREPKPYSRQDLEAAIEKVQHQFSVYFESDAWKRIQNRKHVQLVEVQAKRQNNQRQSTNTYQDRKPTYNNNNNNKQAPKERTEPIAKIEGRGTAVNVISNEVDGHKTLIVKRQVEDSTVAVRKEQMKAHQSWIEDQKTTDSLKILQKDINFLLNLLAPDNFSKVSEKVINVLIDNPHLAEYVAERIIEKSQLEPKYRALYTELCQAIYKDQNLQVRKQDGKSQSLFRNALLNKVQNIFESNNKSKQKINEELSAEKREEAHIIRKQKIMGNVRFIGDLHLKNILPAAAVNIASHEMLMEFLDQELNVPELNEGTLEGFVELLDQIGGYSKATKSLEQDLFNKLLSIFDGTNTSSKKLTQSQLEEISGLFHSLHSQQLFQLLDQIVKNYKLSKRLHILIENLLERKNQGWKDVIHQNNESAKSKNQLYQEQEERDQRQQSSRQSSYVEKKGNNNRSKQQQQEIYVAKESQQFQQVQYNTKDLQEMKSFIEGSFKMEPQDQCDKLAEEFKEILNDSEGQKVFFETLFKHVLKANKSNLQRVPMVYKFQQQCTQQIFDAALAKIFTMDFAYDLMESPLGKDVFIDLILPYVNEKDFTALKKVYLKPGGEDNDEYRDFFVQVIEELTEKAPDSKNEILAYSQTLGYDVQIE